MKLLIPAPRFQDEVSKLYAVSDVLSTGPLAVVENFLVLNLILIANLPMPAVK